MRKAFSFCLGLLLALLLSALGLVVGTSSSNNGIRLGDVIILGGVNSWRNIGGSSGGAAIMLQSRSIRGDVNGDGKINALDITSASRIIAGLDTMTLRADINGDGKMNALDITSLELLIAGIGTKIIRK